MSRPTTQDLYGIDPKEFIGIPYEMVIEVKLDAMHKRREELYTMMTEVTDHNDFMVVNEEFKYVRGAISDLLADYEEMNLDYAKKGK